ncbi:sensor histidine kinase [Kitasatospora purpeofusca]|uniref:sensor histidine kinase n=1 Tax=Kitasatospora purpeofusca TaxID=67352 RepID=UPI0036D32C2D
MTVNVLLQRVLRENVAAMGEQVVIVATPSPSPPGGVQAPRTPLPDLRGGTDLKLAKDLGDSVLRHQWTVTWIAIALLAVTGSAVGWWLSGRVLRPVHRITATARRLSLSNLHERIALDGPQDELRELADTFDEMLGRLERAADGQRRFAANASHELRTPLAIQRAAIEIGLQDPSPEQVARMRVELLQATARTERLIDGLMILAQGERGPEQSDPVDLADIARDAADQHHRGATDAGVTLALDLHPAPSTGDPVLLTRLAANLIDNAIRHNHPEGSVLIRTSPDSVLTVTNTGPHVPADRVPELFEPFRRLHSPRTGSAQGAGLGLSIVAAIAQSHGAEVHATPNAEGGLTVSVTLPRRTIAHGPGSS